MRRSTSIIATLLGLVSLAATPVLADVISVPTPFSSLAVVDTYTVAGDLTIQAGGSILCNDPATPNGASACPIKIVVSGNMTMEPGSAILAENTVGSGSGADIEITVGGNFVMQGGLPGAKISSSDKTGGGTTGNAGSITIVVGTPGAPPTGDFTMQTGASIVADSVNHSAGAIVINVAGSADVDGLVESFGGMSGVPNQPPGGGPITVNAGCDLNVSDTGKISSRGIDPGADLVHVQGGCAVTIYGLVESTGVGHARPPNHCVIAGKPATSTACVEVVGGNSVTIDAINHNGEVSADTGGPGGSAGTGWVDVYARGPISIIGDVVTPFAVHANGSAGTNDVGGWITVMSRDASVVATGLALQTDALGGGGSGGRVVVEAGTLINLDTARIFARGDMVATGGYGKGGSQQFRSYQGSLSWQDGIGDVRPTGATIAAGSRGVITFFDCNNGAGVDTTNTSFPAIGAPTTPVVSNPGACGGNPFTPLPLPDCACAVSPSFQACVTVTKFCTDAAAFGEPIHFQGDVTNSCTDPLSNVTVVDDSATAGTGDDQQVLGPTTLAPGESKHYSGQYTPSTSPSTDTVTATGTGDNTQQSVSAQASATCTIPAQSGEGCTPGFWKNHTEAWASTGYPPTDVVNQYFTVAPCTSLGTKTLTQALSLGGGGSFCAKVGFLLRSGVAALLNASSGGVSYPYTPAEVISLVNNAIATGITTTVSTLATEFDAANNLGCPLN